MFIIGGVVLAAKLAMPVYDVKYGDAGELRTRYDFKQSLKVPFYGAKEQVLPHFGQTGSLASREKVRLTSSMPLQHGQLWCTEANPHKEWMVEFSVIVSGRYMSGTDGFAFWYTSQKGQTEHTDFYGASSQFDGIGIVFDSSDESQDRINPFIYGLKNDKSKKLADFADYSSPKTNIGSCFREIRNTPGPVFVKVKYVNRVLSVEVDIRQRGQSYTSCFNATDIDLPSGHYFRISASTDQNGADDHDLQSFETYELNPKFKEHKLRPFEKADILAGHKFEIDDKMMANLGETLKSFDHLKHDIKHVIGLTSGNAPDIPQDQAIKKMTENQFHILEGLNLIQQKMGLEQTPGKHGETKEELTSMRSKLEGFGDIDTLKKSIADLHAISQKLNEQTEKLLKEIAQQVSHSAVSIQETKEKLNSIPDGSSSAWSAIYSALYIFATIAGFGILFMGYTAAKVAMKQNAPKKFI